MNWEQAWLEYHKIDGYDDGVYFSKYYSDKKSVIITNAIGELKTAVYKMLGISMEESNEDAAGIVIKSGQFEMLSEEGFLIEHVNDSLHVVGQEKGILYGIFQLIRMIGTREKLSGISIKEIPSNHLRMLNHWDNIDGSIERGYSGQSFFFKSAEIIVNDRTKDYARLIASVGINAVVINNVNVSNEAIELITPKYFQKLAEMSQIFYGYGIKLFLSLDFAAPIDVGGLGTADPLDKTVSDWWQKQAKLVFENIPNFGGFLVKADSEGRPGPYTYNRTQAEGANVLANAVNPYGGIIIWRCFVYNCQQDWRDLKTDRARAAYDNFMQLDGMFAENVILQIKNGPVDFQVREPITPLFGGLKETNQMLEVQIAQEYTGQQRHVCYLIPWFKQILEFQTFCSIENGSVADIVAGKTFNQKNCGIATVVNTGDDENWTGHDLAAANLYGFGRLSWNTTLLSDAIAKEWIALTFKNEKKVIQTILNILMVSWCAYEKYTAPLGIGWMCNPSDHYGPNVDGFEYDRWGTYHRADCKGIGVDRSTNGTGYASQYNEPLASEYENADTCPEKLLLFFHHMPYDYVLSSGKTIIQHIYDTHFEGVAEVDDMVAAWETLKGLISDKAYQRTMERFVHQQKNSREWRDVINSYFYRKTFIKDEHDRKIY